MGEGPQLQPYMKDKCQDKARISFNFRLGNHILPVERMRYCGATRQQRLCKTEGCRERGEIGDEMHVFYCQGNAESLQKIWEMIGMDNASR